MYTLNFREKHDDESALQWKDPNARLGSGLMAFFNIEIFMAFAVVGFFLTTLGIIVYKRK
jgi:hypothetical protein